jgi:hypothetical protein
MKMKEKKIPPILWSICEAVWRNLRFSRPHSNSTI